MRTFCLAVGVLLLASCGSGPVPRFQGLGGLLIDVEPISVAPGDHVDVVMIYKGQEITVLQDMEVLSYKSYARRDRRNHLFDSVRVKSTGKDRARFMQVMLRDTPDRDIWAPLRLRKN